MQRSDADDEHIGGTAAGEPLCTWARSSNAIVEDGRSRPSSFWAKVRPTTRTRCSFDDVVWFPARQPHERVDSEVGDSPDRMALEREPLDGSQR